MEEVDSQHFNMCVFFFCLASRPGKTWGHGSINDSILIWSSGLWLNVSRFWFSKSWHNHSDITSKLQWAGLKESQSSIHRRLMEQKYRGYTRRCKPLLLALAIRIGRPDWNCQKSTEMRLRSSGRLKGETPLNNHQLKEAAVKAWNSVTRKEYKCLVMSVGCRLDAVIARKGFATKY